ncbi:MAG: SIMPL domain-containing protein [Alphaproteobacteria bacterium]|nr:SIMPL domain-containing protein [Alphaproteobacteria bacterium]
MKEKTIWILSIVLCAFVLGWWSIERIAEPRTISVTGECLTTAPKDRTAITIRVSVTDKSAAKSMKIASTKIAEINTFLKTLDVRVQTTEFNSYEKNEWNHTTQKSEFIGIETNIALEVSAANVDTIETVLTKFAGTPDVFVTNLRMFTSAETLKPILESCLGDAVANARERADALAAGVGRRVGKMLAASYGTGTSYNPMTAANFRLAKAEMASADMGYAGGAITGKDTDVSVSVSAIFEIR